MEDERDRRGNRLRQDGLTAATRERFLAVLAATSSVGKAAAEAGAAVSSFYRRRERDVEFDARWKAALDRGYESLEARLLGMALVGVGSEGDGEAIDPTLGLELLKRRGAIIAGGGRPRGAVTRRVPIAEVEATIARRLASVARRLGAVRGKKK